MSFRLLSVTLWFAAVLFVLYGLGVAFLTILGDASSYPLIGPMLNRPHAVDRIPPILILFLTAWVLIVIALKQRDVRRQHRAITTFQTQMAEADQNRYQPKAFDLRQPRAVRRADLIIECSRREPSSLHEAVPAAAALDAGTLAAGYGPLNIYAWILPVLGFIGTASGMASSIAGFSDVLSGPVQVDTLQLQAQLSKSVIPGLAAAFETTILALTAALVAYLCTNALRSWDQEALDQLDRLCIVLLSRIPQPPTPDGQKILAVLEQISEQIRGVIQIPDSLTQATAAISQMADTLNASGQQFASTITSIGPAAENLASAGNQTHAAAKAMQDAADALRQSLGEKTPLKNPDGKDQDLASALRSLQEAVLRPITIKMSRE